MSTSPAADLPSKPAPDWPMLLRGVGGAVLGAVLGYFVFRWLRSQGMLGDMLPGFAIGMLGGYLARGKSQILAVFCAILAVVATLFTEWHVQYSEKHTFVDFLTKLPSMNSVRLLLMGFGVVCAYWFGRGR
ncbi:MAG: hypothetical protein SFU86_03465 [Pirellulaceae bacterium]|nr:hypothetical protein [Pirellulaceae bacterium]